MASTLDTSPRSICATRLFVTPHPIGHLKLRQAQGLAPFGQAMAIDAGLIAPPRLSHRLLSAGSGHEASTNITPLEKAP
ncbi:hypothetical protein [Nonomuraea solani]|uniref:hypothetical protein n=1 Tax=Nonomuraea solani TaxID=1144553 RepID=UPI001357158A|nr:hypothetical protein [Nonomuraea solani]